MSAWELETKIVCNATNCTKHQTEKTLGWMEICFQQPLEMRLFACALGCVVALLLWYGIHSDLCARELELNTGIHTTLTYCIPDQLIVHISWFQSQVGYDQNFPFCYVMQDRFYRCIIHCCIWPYAYSSVCNEFPPRATVPDKCHSHNTEEHTCMWDLLSENRTWLKLELHILSGALHNLNTNQIHKSWDERTKGHLGLR